MDSLPTELLAGLKDWAVGETTPEASKGLGDPGPYMALLTFDDPATAQKWLKLMMQTWNTK